MIFSEPELGIEIGKEVTSIDNDMHEIVLTYYDGSCCRVLVSDIETSFPDGCLIVSRTDVDGVITHVNQSFIDMSGYSKEELIGQPHSILRHPDMPEIAFKGLWDTINSGGKWRGYVKNLRKDGGYYWVFATVIPNIRNNIIIGYTSVRRKPSHQRIKECIELYSRM